MHDEEFGYPTTKQVQDSKLKVKEEAKLMKFQMEELNEEDQSQNNDSSEEHLSNTTTQKEHITGGGDSKMGLEWAMKIGIPKEEDKGQSVQELLKPGEEDVYPLSIAYTDPQKVRMKIIRIVTFILCFYFVIPFDLYIKSDHRLYFYGTESHESRISFDSNTTLNFTFNIQNCKVSLFKDSEDSRSFMIEYGFEFGTSHQLNGSTLNITAKPTGACILNLYLPVSTPLPQMIFNITGTQDNILFEDSQLSGASLIFENGLSIVGDTVFMKLSNHNITNLTVNMQFAVCEFRNIISNQKNIYLLGGLYNEILNSDTIIVNATVIQPDGNICLFGPVITQLDNSTCNAINSFKSTNSTSTTCQITSLMCNAGNDTTCMAPIDQLIPQIFVSLVDGPIQIRYPEVGYSSYTQLFKQSRTKISYSNAALQTLNSSATIFKTDLANDRIHILQHIGLDYEETWLYTNKLAYLQAQYWPLTWGSAGLLRPLIDKSKIVAIDYTCPSRPSDDIWFQSDVNNWLYSNYPTTSISQVAFVEEYNQIYQLTINNFGNAQYQQIMMSQNSGIVNAFIIAAIIAFLGALIGVQLSVIAVSSAKGFYDKFLNSQKKLAISKKQFKEVQKEGSQDLRKVLLEFESFGKVYEHRELFRTSFKIDQDVIVNEKLQFRFSLFQIPALILDYIFRKIVINSLSQFLMQINESKLQFNPSKMKQHDKSEISIPSYEFQAIYSDFCQKEGFTELQLLDENGKKIISDFGMEIIDGGGNQDPAYVNIRIKTSKEKAESQSNNESSSITGSVKLFLQTECVQSKFDTDFISFQEIKHRYQSFCKIIGIQESQREQIIGSETVIEFGAAIDFRNPPPILVGVKTGKPDYPSTTPDTFGLIKLPCSLQQGLISKITAIDGIIVNASISIVHFILILVVPAITPIISFMALCEMTTLQSNVYSSPVTVADFFHVNRLDPWWNNTPYVDIVEYIHIYVIVYLVFAYVEVLSFYLTGYDNNGKFPVRYSRAKKYFMYGFYSTLGVLLFLYFAMVWFVLVWVLLAAILNPSVFLPYTAAALALMATVSAKLIFYRKKYETVVEDFKAKIEENIGAAFKKNIESIKSMAEGVGVDSQVNQFQNGITSMLSSNGKMPMDSNPSIATISSNASQSLGLHPAIMEVLISVTVQDQAAITTSLKTMGEGLNVNPSLLESIVQVSLCPFNPAQRDKQKSYAMMELAVIKLFSVLSPRHAIIDKLGEICSVVLEKNSSPILANFDKLIPRGNKQKQEEAGRIKQILKILNFTIKGKHSQTRQEYVNMVQSLLNLYDSTYFEMFRLLIDLRETDISIFLNESSKFDSQNKKSAGLMGFKHTYPILCLSDVFTQSTTLSINVLINTLKEVLADGDMLTSLEQNDSAQNFNTHLQVEPLTVRYFIALLQVLKGNRIDVKSIAKQVNKKNLTENAIDGDILESIHSISFGSVQGLEQVIFKLGCSHSREILVEFYHLLNMKYSKCPKICSMLTVEEAFQETFTNLVHLLYQILTYDLIKDQNDNSNDLQLLRHKVYKSLKCIKDAQGMILRLEPSLVPLKFKNQEELIQDDSEPRSPNRVIPEPSSIDQLLGSVENCENNENSLKNQLLKYFPDNPVKGFLLHLDLWDTVQSALKQDTTGLIVVNESAFQFIRNMAIIILKQQHPNHSTLDANYQRCVKMLASFFEIKADVLEFLIDTTQASPIHIFKGQLASGLSYNLGTDHQASNHQLKGSFDHSRLHLLSHLTNGSQSILIQVFFTWYHQFKYSYIAKGSTNSHLIQSFGTLSVDFIRLIETQREVLEESDEKQELLKEYINEYLRMQLENIIHNQNQPISISPQYGVTDKFFGPSLPFKLPQIEIYGQQEVFQDSLIMRALQKLRDLDKQSLMKVTCESQSKSPKLKVLKSFLKAAEYKNSLPLFLRYLIDLSKLVCGAKQEQSQAFEIVIDIQEMIGLAILLNAKQLQQMCTNNMHSSDPDQMSQDITNDLNELIAASKEGSQYAPIHKKHINHFMSCLHENNFLSKVEVGLIKPLSSSLSDANCLTIAELLLGTAINDKQLIRSSLIEMISPKTKADSQVLEVLISILLGDTQNKEDIKEVCTQQLDINGELYLQLMDLTSQDTQKLPQIILSLLSSNPRKEENSLCQGLISFFKHDLSSTSVLSNRLGIENSKSLAVLAAATGQFTILKEYLSLIQQSMNLNSMDTVKFLLQISHGHSDCIEQLVGLSDDLFEVHDQHLAKALFEITAFGWQASSLKQQNRDSLTNSDSLIDIISSKITNAFEMKSNNADDLEGSLRILVKSCWNDRTALSQLLNKLMENVGEQSIWHSGQKGICQSLTEPQIIEFIQQHLNKIIESEHILSNYIYKTQNDMINQLCTIILPIITIQNEEEDVDELETITETVFKSETTASRYLKTVRHKLKKDGEAEISKFESSVRHIESFYKSNNSYQSRLRELADDKKHLCDAYKIGCTFGITKHQKATQPLYICLTCTKGLNEADRKSPICTVCTMFCHNGHQIQQIADDLFVKDYCRCGAGCFEGSKSINSKNPIPSCQGKTKCKVAHKIYEKIVAKANDLAMFGSSSLLTSSHFNSKLSQSQFLDDLSKALQLPSYFQGDPTLVQELNLKGILQENGTSLLESKSSTYKTFAENIILMAAGHITGSFVSILSVKKQYSAKIHSLQDPGNEAESIGVYNALNTLIALAQQDLDKFKLYGVGLANIFGESGTAQSPAVDKLQKVLLLGKGGQMPDFSEDLDSPSAQIFKDPYSEIFKQLFGINWKPMIALHKCLTLQGSDLVDALNLNALDSSKSTSSVQQKLDKDRSLKNMVQWVDEILFERYLKLSEKSVNYCKSIIGLIYRHPSALDFIAKEKGISASKANQMKAMIMSQDSQDLKQIFAKFNTFVPESLSEELKKLLDGHDSSKVVEFIVKHILVKEQVIEVTWDEAAQIPEKYELRVNQIRSHLTNLHQMMTGNIKSIEGQLTSLLSIYQQKDLVKGNEDNQIEILPSYISLFGLLYQDQHRASMLSEVLHYPSLPTQLLDSIISLRSGKKSTNMLDDAVFALTGLELSKSDHGLKRCKLMQKALSGDIISLTAIVEQLSGQDSHLRSLMASLVTGKTHYDTHDAGLKENLLLREVFRLFETAVKLDYKDGRVSSQKVESFIEKCFNEKVPLYLTLILTEHEGLMKSLFEKESHFIVSLKSQERNQKDRQYLQNFIEFLDPFNADVSIEPLLEYLLKAEKGQIQFEIPVFPSLLETQPIKVSSSTLPPIKKYVEEAITYKADMIEFLNMVFNCVSSDSITAVNKLFDSLLLKSLGQNPMFQEIVQLQRAILGGTDILKQLPSLIKLISLTINLEQGPQLDNFSIMITQWFQCITTMLNKDQIVILNPSKLFQKAVNATMIYYTDRKDNPFGASIDNINYLVDVLAGLASLSRGDIQGIRPLALKLGGFPQHTHKIEQFVKQIKQNKDAILQLKQAGENQVTIKPLITKDILKIDEASTKLFDPKFIFEHFANSQGKMGFNEFKNMLRQLNLPFSEAEIMKHFSAADVHKKGELNFDDFGNSLETLKSALVKDLMKQLGVSIQDMAVAFGLSIAMLSLTLGFIFVGIKAFAPASSFSSVTNTMLPMGAGLAANGKEEESKKKVNTGN